jgi:hypothetical protein
MTAAPRKASEPETCLIYDDAREIESINGQIGCWTSGDGVRIVAYKEHGQGDYVPYYAVYRGDEIVTRVPASFVAVHYVSAQF